MKKMVVFASGSGTNAENIIKYFNEGEIAAVVKVFTNNPNAKVIERAKNNNVPTEIFSKSEMLEAGFLEKVNESKPDLIVLAGFLLKLPENVIEAYRDKIINIHPALLPKYGGKGMYGLNVHRAIVENKEKETGITIHYVDENYDEGSVIFQERISLTGNETPEEIAAKVHELEHRHFPEVIANLLE